MANVNAAQPVFHPELNPPAVNMEVTRVSLDGGLLRTHPVGCRATVVAVGRTVITVRLVGAPVDQVSVWKMDRWARWVEPKVEPKTGDIVVGSKIMLDHGMKNDFPGYPMPQASPTGVLIVEKIAVKFNAAVLSVFIGYPYALWWPMAMAKLAEPNIGPKIGDVITVKEDMRRLSNLPDFLQGRDKVEIADVKGPYIKVSSHVWTSSWMSRKWFNIDTSITVAKPPPKPPEPVVGFAEFVERFKPKNGGGCAVYGGITKNSAGPDYTYCGYTGCHSSLIQYTLPNSYRVWVNCCNKPYHKRWLEYIMDPELSPWRLLVPHVIVKDLDNGGCVFFVDTEASKTLSAQYLASFAKVTRVYTEYARCGEVLDYLLDNGVHPGIAIWFSQYFGAVGTASLTAYPNGWHGSFNQNNWAFEVMENFLAGKTPNNEPRSAERNNSYFGVDSIFHQKDHKNATRSLSEELRDFMPELFKEDKIQGRFTTTVKAVFTKENVLKAALSLTDRLGFTDA